MGALSDTCARLGGDVHARRRRGDAVRLFIVVIDPQRQGLPRLDSEFGRSEGIVLLAVRTELVGGDDLQIDLLCRRSLAAGAAAAAS